jgi:hypothetical protein
MNATDRQAAHAAFEPSQEQLKMAMRLLARPGWPTTLEAVLSSPVYGPLVRILARRMNRPSWMNRGSSELPNAPTTSTLAAPLPRLNFDPRSLAANDR